LAKARKKVLVQSNTGIKDKSLYGKSDFAKVSKNLARYKSGNKKLLDP